MPVYTYRCEECGIQFERTQMFSDAPLKRCPECGKSSLRKVYTPVGIVFKGSGFYATDHRSASGATRYEHSDSKSKSESSKNSEIKSSEGATSSSTSETKSSSTETASAAKKAE